MSSFIGKTLDLVEGKMQCFAGKILLLYEHALYGILHFVIEQVVHNACFG